MFTYIDPDVRKRLRAEGKLIRIDADGRTITTSLASTDQRDVIDLLGPIPLPMDIRGEKLNAQWYAAVRDTELAKVHGLADRLAADGGPEFFATLTTSLAVNSVLVFGQPGEMSRPLVRVHSNCLTGDVFGSLRCECGPQLQAALAQISNEKQGGILIYMAGHEGRGIGLWAKAATYLLQEAGENTYQANQSLGLPDDSRDFRDAAILLKYFGLVDGVRLLTNNPKKIDELTEHGIKNITPVAHVVGVGKHNRRYLHAKKDWGHRLGAEDLEGPENSD